MYFCSAPFTHMTVNPHGVAVPCLSGRWLGRTGGDLTLDSIEDAWNAPECQDVRRSILDGSFQYCHKDSCPFYRQVAPPVQLRDEVDDPFLLEIIRQNSVVLDRLPVSLGLAYDPTCDLACRHCHLEKAQVSPEVTEVYDLVHRKTWDFLPDVEDAWLSFDGEPFVSTYYFRGLREFQARGGHLPRLHLFTNATRFTPENWEAIKGIQPAIFEIQVNLGTAKEATYRAYQGGDFSAVMKNLEFIAQLKEAGAPWTLAYRFVVHGRNFREMPAYRRLAGTLRADRVVFSRIESASVSDDEFETLAVHRPQHPQYFELLDLLDEVERTDGPETNVLDYAKDILSDENLVWPADVSFDDACEILDIGPRSECEIRGIIREYREQLTQILGLPDGTGDVPLDALAEAAVQGNGATGTAAAGDLSDRLDVNGVRYVDHMSKAHAAAHARIMRVLTVSQRVKVGLSPCQSPVDFPITNDPFEAELARRAEALAFTTSRPKTLSQQVTTFVLGAYLWIQEAPFELFAWAGQDVQVAVRYFRTFANMLSAELA